jgi:hypothetical protein
MTREEMKNRLKVFAGTVIKLVDKLPNTPAGRSYRKLSSSFRNSPEQTIEPLALES